jgi:diguanylate cyclase (GGDEF)-like protein
LWSRRRSGLERRIAETLVVSIPVALGARWEFAGLAVVATLVTAALLVSTVRAAARHERGRSSDSGRQDRRRRTHGGRPDPREALALVGDALAATHNPRALLPVILDVITEATGARGGRLVHQDSEIGWVGEVDGASEELEFELSAGDDEGVTRLFLYPPADGFSAETRQLAEWLASQASIALENARLHDIVQRQAMTDELTGLVNRRRFISALEAEIESALALGGLVSVILVDLDDFKRINDRFGHHMGDTVLQAFASLLEAHVRDIDVAGRLGGEEFAILLPATDLAGAAATAERLRRSLGERPLAGADDRELSVTASFGVAEHAEGQTGDELLRIADAALYRAKNQGKNRVCSARASSAV